MSCFADDEFASFSTCGECGLMGPLDKVQQHYLDSHFVDGNVSCNETEDLQLEDPEECETEASTSLGGKTSLITNRGHKSDGNNEWCEAETILLLDKYETYLKQVGPMKKFKRKKDMWQQISKDIETILNVTKTLAQCENRYKTILKRKKKAVDNNSQTGRNRVQVEYEAELAKIAALDDSIEPEVLRDSRNVRTVEKPGNDDKKSLKRKREKSVQEVLMEISKQKEEARERRHKDKMKMLEKFLEQQNK